MQKKLRSYLPDMTASIKIRKKKKNPASSKKEIRVRSHLICCSINLPINMVNFQRGILITSHPPYVVKEGMSRTSCLPLNPSNNCQRILLQNQSSSAKYSYRIDKYSRTPRIFICKQLPSMASCINNQEKLGLKEATPMKNHI